MSIKKICDKLWYSYETAPPNFQERGSLEKFVDQLRAKIDKQTFTASDLQVILTTKKNGNHKRSV